MNNSWVQVEGAIIREHRYIAPQFYFTKQNVRIYCLYQRIELEGNPEPIPCPDYHITFPLEQTWTLNGYRHNGTSLHLQNKPSKGNLVMPTKFTPQVVDSAYIENMGLAMKVRNYKEYIRANTDGVGNQTITRSSLSSVLKDHPEFVISTGVILVALLSTVVVFSIYLCYKSETKPSSASIVKNIGTIPAPPAPLTYAPMRNHESAFYPRLRSPRGIRFSQNMPNSLELYYSELHSIVTTANPTIYE